MKKNLITLIAAISILASSTAVFAEATPAPEVNKPVLISENVTEEKAAVMPSYVSNTVTVTEVSEGKIATTTNVKDAENMENVINFTTSEETLVFAANGEKKTLADVKKDSNVTVFTDSYSPAVLMLPAQYSANVIILNDAKVMSNVNVDTYIKVEEALVNAGNTLALNVADTTKVVDKDGKKVDAELANKDLIVFYTNSTRSIPAQTTPETVVVLGENETALAQIKANSEVIPAPESTTAPEATATPEATEAPAVETVKASTSFKAENGTVMVPVREVATALGFTVDWDGETRTVLLNSGKYSIKVDENSYAAGKMMPVELSNAPVIKNDLTFVPVEYFTQVLGVAEGTIVTE